MFCLYTKERNISWSIFFLWISLHPNNHEMYNLINYFPGYKHQWKYLSILWKNHLINELRFKSTFMIFQPNACKADVLLFLSFKWFRIKIKASFFFLISSVWVKHLVCWFLSNKIWQIYSSLHAFFHSDLKLINFLYFF